MTTTLCPSQIAHLVQVVGGRRTGYRAECRCGWASAWTSERAPAHATARRHPHPASGAPHGPEPAIRDLLDLQDDLADAVLWLGENWAPGLPTPLVRSGVPVDAAGRPIASVSLSVRCERAEDLAWVATLVGRPHAARNVVVHPFGRVCLVATRATAGVAGDGGGACGCG
jgi:hypothetical protein